MRIMKHVGFSFLHIHFGILTARKSTAEIIRLKTHYILLIDVKLKYIFNKC